MVSDLMSALTVQYVIHDYKEINSLARYAGALLNHLQTSPEVEMRIAVVKDIPLPNPLLASLKSAGIDVAAFFRTYPFFWPQVEGDVIHLTHRSQTTLLTRKPSVPVVVTVHDIIHYQYRDDPNMHIYSHGPHRWMDAIAIQAMRRADVLIASSEYTRQALIDVVKVAPERVNTVYLGVDTARFRPVSVPPSFFQRLNLDPRGRYILHVSTEEPRKDVPSLVRAFALLRRDFPDVKLIKAGMPLYPRAPLLELIKQLKLEDSVIFVDRVTDEDLVALYNIARMSVMPSLAEGFGFPVLESMACGTPVVSSTGGSLAEIGGEAALTFAPRDVEAMAEAMASLLRDDTLHETKRQLGLQQAARFTWEATAAQTLEIYRQVSRKVYA
jgi:glycosyltransferase involved in cell wall biosynthesis